MSLTFPLVRLIGQTRDSVYCTSGFTINYPDSVTWIWRWLPRVHLTVQHLRLVLVPVLGGHGHVRYVRYVQYRFHLRSGSFVCCVL